jgi:hypothetical protein
MVSVWLYAYAMGITSSRRVSADSGFFALDAWQKLEEQKVDAYVPDSNLARVLNRGRALARSGAAGGVSTHAAEVAPSGRASDLRPTQGPDRAGLRRAEGAAGDETVPTTRPGERGGRGGPGGHRLQPHADLEHPTGGTEVPLAGPRGEFAPWQNLKEPKASSQKISWRHPRTGS